MRHQKKLIPPKQFYVDYNYKLSNVLKKEHFIELENLTKTIEKKIRLKKNIFVCGNGGSASVSNHFLCDFNKGIKLSSNKKLFPRVISLVNSIDIITAISNDLSYNEIFSNQIENHANSGDALIIISCSGSSKNIIEAVKYAKKKKLDVIAFVGFGNNKFIKKSSKHYLNLKTKNYGLTEDIFQAMMHMISQYLRKKYSKNKLEIL